MKLLLSILLATVISQAALAQDQGSSQDQSGSQHQATPSQSGQNQPDNTSTGAQNMSGTVSQDGKTFTSDRDSQKYRVDNPEAFKGREDQHVAFLVEVDPGNNVIHIMESEPPQ
jgi:hypothetical protein